MRVIVLRERHENPKKCSLTPLRGRPGIEWIAFEPERIFEFPEAVLLDPGGPPLSVADKGRPLLVLDCSWRRLPALRRNLRGRILARSIPPAWATAYPRRSKTFKDPPNGLASIEALFAATTLLGEPAADLLEGYRWREAFLERNRQRFLGPGCTS